MDVNEPREIEAIVDDKVHKNKRKYYQVRMDDGNTSWTIEVKNTALIAISTPLDSSNFYSTAHGGGLLILAREESEFHVSNSA